MKHWTRIALIGGFLLATGFLKAADWPFQQHKSFWYTDLDKAHQVALKQNKPLLLLFTSKNCLFCRKLEAETLASPTIQKRIREQFVPVLLDLEKNARAARILKIQGVPTTIIITPQADLIGRIEGFVEPKTFETQLAKAQSVHAQLTRIRQTAMQNGQTKKQ